MYKYLAVWTRRAGHLAGIMKEVFGTDKRQNDDVVISDHTRHNHNRNSHQICLSHSGAGRFRKP